MGDQGANPQANRAAGGSGSEEFSAAAVATDDGQGGDFDVRLGERDVPKWIRPAVWAGIPLVLLALYLFALPVPIIFLENNDLLSSGGPKLYAFLEAVFRPISWLYENVDAYQEYIHWWEDRLA